MIDAKEMPYSKIANLHKRLAKKHGKASKCENEYCKSINPKRFEWALKKGNTYSDNPNDYMQLCPSCHRLYDYTDAQRQKQSVAKKGIPKSGNQLKFVQMGIDSRKRKVFQYSKCGKLIKEWDTASQAAYELNISQSAIVNNLKNNSKTSGGYIWIYKN